MSIPFASGILHYDFWQIAHHEKQAVTFFNCVLHLRARALAIRASPPGRGTSCAVMTACALCFLHLELQPEKCWAAAHVAW
jgi:hypothetical protein